MANEKPIQNYKGYMMDNKLEHEILVECANDVSKYYVFVRKNGAADLDGRRLAGNGLAVREVSETFRQADTRRR